jgi:hypothetical protein
MVFASNLLRGQPAACVQPAKSTSIAATGARLAKQRAGPRRSISVFIRARRLARRRAGSRPRPVMERISGPERATFDKTWKPGDIQQI